MASQKLKVVICLIRNDLRYLDNEVLLRSHRNADQVLPLYCFDPRHFKGTYHFDLPKTGSYRLKFLLESINDLRKTLVHHGSNLILRRGKPEVIVPEIISELGKENVSAVIFQKEATREELDVEDALKKNCDVNVISVWGSTLYHIDDAPFKIPQTPDVFTQFRKRVEEQSRVRPEQDMPKKLKPLPQGIDEGEIPTCVDLGQPEPRPDSRSVFPFGGGESSGQARLHQYLFGTDKVATYIDTRNGMVGDQYSTKFSVWLAHGCISPRSIYWQLKKYEQQRTANKSTYWVIFELIWRDYFKYVALKFGDKLFHRDGVFGKKIPWKQDMKSFEAWKEGRTGVPYVDANMRELASTGFMSNRGRQNVASFLTKDLKLDWRLGAEWFESQLLDHDVASNYGNWLYSAGIGNDPRQDRKFNVIKQGTDYDPQGDYVRLWIPELSKISGRDIHVPFALSSATLSHADVSLGETYPTPIVTAPEWSKYIRAGSNAGAKGGKGPGSRRPPSRPHKGQRGIDYYFQGQNH